MALNLRSSGPGKKCTYKYDPATYGPRSSERLVLLGKSAHISMIPSAYR
jgi:hypothetical protein